MSSALTNTRSGLADSTTQLEGVNLATPSLRGTNDASTADLDFASKQREYFAGILKEKWACDIPEHSVCVPTQDGGHHQISDAGMTVWVSSLCCGESTTSQPPNGVLLGVGMDANEKEVPRAVSIAPSRRRSTKSSVFLRSASFRSQPVDASSYSSASGALGPGYRGGQFIEWLGQKTLNAVEASIIIGRMRQHRSLLAKLSKARDTEIEADFGKNILTIFEDALEVTKPIYSRRVNGYASSIARNILTTSWRMVPVFWADDRDFAMQLYCSTMVLELVLLLPEADDLACELVSILTKAPLSLQGVEDFSAFICPIADELSYSHHPPVTHRRLWRLLTRVVRHTLSARGLTSAELMAIRGLLTCRMQARGKPLYGNPYEVLIFARCAIRHSEFKEVVSGPCGIPSLLIALKYGGIYRSDPLDFWQNVHVVAKLLWQDPCFISAEDQAELLPLLLQIFRAHSSEDEIQIYEVFTTIDSIRIIVTRKPELVDVYLQGDAVERLEQAVVAAGSSGSHRDEFRREELVDSARAIIAIVEERRATVNLVA